jgi:hypothetical protein
VLPRGSESLEFSAQPRATGLVDTVHAPCTTGARLSVKVLRTAFSRVVVPVVLLLAGCEEGGRAPTLEDVDDQVVAVGDELVVNLRATDPDGDAIDYGFDADVEHIHDRADLTVRPDGTAVFRWTPLAADVGEWAFDFIASDGSDNDVVTTTIEVVSATDGTAPLFREPLGSGTTLDLGVTACLELDVVVDDPDSAAVTIGQAEPIITGAVIVQETGLSATWSWCPAKDQMAGEDRYPLVLFADDGDNEPVLKHYLIVLRHPPQPDCPGKGPSIVHEPIDMSSDAEQLEIMAEVSDDLGLAGSPIVYFSGEEPRQPIDFGALDVAEMELGNGNMREGVWTARVPNPVAGEPAGTTANLYYIISARDDDDAAGDCDHVTDAPEGAAFAMAVTNPGDEPPACEDDELEDNDTRVMASNNDPTPANTYEGLVACGGDDDWYRVVLGNEGTLGALVEGGEGANLDLGLYDRFGNVIVTSEEASSSEVVEECLEAGTYYVRVFSGGNGDNTYDMLVDVTPGMCETAACEDDSFEPDDMMGGATEVDLDAGPFEANNRMICSGDDDFYAVELDTGDTIVVDLLFTHGAANEDLDLHFFDAEGVDLTPCSEEDPWTCTPEQGQSADSNEHFEWTVEEAGCAPCSFYVAVRGYDDAENDYDIEIAK